MKTHSENLVEQITRPSTNSWVAANAGSGKTYVLTQRVIRLLLAGTDPSRILCLTYTKAAAAEMKSRVFDVLRDWVHVPDDALRAIIQSITGEAVSERILMLARTLFARALETPGGLKIETIHAFCERILQQFPFEAPVPANFKMVDDAQSATLWNAAFTKIYEAGLNVSNPLYADVMHVYGFLGAYNFETQLKAMLSKRGQLMHLMRVMNDEQALKNAYLDILKLPNDISLEWLEQQFLRMPFHDQNWCRRCAEALILGGKYDKDRVPILKNLRNYTHWQHIYEAALPLIETGEGKLRAKPFAYGEARKITPDICDMYDAAVQELIAFRALYNGHYTLQTSMSCCTLAIEALKHYQHLKLQQRFLDFDDLILKTRDLLTNTNVSFVQYRLDSAIDHILLDEAQDTSLEQWDIMRQLAADFYSGESARAITRTLFVVGDEKQSIYRFQGAMPERFHAMKLHFEAEIRDAKGQWCAQPLEISYRSTTDVLAAVDVVFNAADLKENLTASASTIRHITNRETAVGCVELWPLCFPPEKDTLAPIWEVPSPEQEALNAGTKSAVQSLVAQIVSAVRELLQNPHYVHETNKATGEQFTRRINAGDILILVQKRKAVFEAVLKGLRDAKLPVAGADKLTLSEHIAVQDLLALADVMFMPSDDLSLSVVLKSPIFGLSEEDIFALAHARNCTLWNTLMQRAHEQLTWTQAFETLKFAQNLAQHARPYEFYTQILRGNNDTVWQAFIARMGEDVQEILEEFLNIILQYETNNVPSLFGFVQWMRNTQHQLKREMSETSHNIRILTVHNAKGLEAPIVLLAETSLADNPQKTPKILPVPFEGLFLPMASQTNANIDVVDAAKEQLKAQDEAENLRLLYVAMTRARDRLLVFGALNSKQTKPEKIAKTWYGRIQDGLKNWPEKDGFSVNTRPTEFGDVLQYKTSTADLVLPFNEKAPNIIVQRVETAPIAPIQPLDVQKPIGAREFVNKIGGLSSVDKEAAKGADKSAILYGMQRGTILHNLLEYAPKLPELAQIAHVLLQEKIAENYIEQVALELRNEFQNLYAAPKFAAILQGNLYKEVPILGHYKDGASIISGRIDLISECDNRLYIVDYKTELAAPTHATDIPQEYTLQLQIYANIVQKLYPNHKIQPVLIYTNSATIFEMPFTNA